MKQNKSVYLCGPITAVKDDGIKWRQSLTVELLKVGITVNDPTKLEPNGIGEVAEHKRYFQELVQTGQLKKLKKEFKDVIKKDLDFVKRSEFIIFKYIPSVPMVGSIEELVLAKKLNKRVLMIVKHDDLQYINPWILRYVKIKDIYTNIKDVIKQIQKEV